MLHTENEIIQIINSIETLKEEDPGSLSLVVKLNELDYWNNVLELHKLQLERKS